MTNQELKSKRVYGFTLIELVTVIVILGVVSVIAIPVYFDYTRDAKEAACRGALGSMRTSIANFRVYRITPTGGGTARFPSVVELTTNGTLLEGALPPNPYDDDGTPNNVVDATGQSKGTVIGTEKGWAYNPTTGEIWANSNSSSGKGSLENRF